MITLLSPDAVGVRFRDLRYFVLKDHQLFQLDEDNIASSTPYDGITDSKIDRVYKEFNILIQEKEKTNGRR